MPPNPGLTNPDPDLGLAKSVLERAVAHKTMLTTAESCTGGMVAAALTEITGSSAAFERGFVTYSNDAKIEMLGVDAAVIKDAGAVSGDVALAMARGAVVNLGGATGDIPTKRLAVAITGIAGPDGGSAEKPVGTVWFATLFNDEGEHTHATKVAPKIEHKVESQIFTGNRAQIRIQATNHALALLLDRLT